MAVLRLRGCYGSPTGKRALVPKQARGPGDARLCTVRRAGWLRSYAPRFRVGRHVGLLACA